VRLAWRELIRRPGRFVTAGAALTLLVLLLLVLGGILDALIGSSTGLLRAQSAPLIAYSANAESSIVRSRIPPSDRDDILAVPGVREATGLGIALLAGHLPGRGEPVDVAVLGYEPRNDAVPAPPAPGEGYADDSLRDDGLRLGRTIELGAARTPVRVVGWVSGTQYNLQRGLWVEPGTWRRALNANITDAAVAPGTFQAVLITPEERTAPASLADRIDSGVPAVSTLTIDEAIAAVPGVTQQQSVFASIIGTTFVVAAIVVALFFALVTIERVGLLGMLKAIGGSNRTLVAGLTLQAVSIATGGLLVGSALALLLASVIPETVPFTIGVGRFAFTAAGVALSAIVGSAVSFRRIVRIDPASAVGGA
jgi:putative ABC transport system permease protein